MFIYFKLPVCLRLIQTDATCLASHFPLYADFFTRGVYFNYYRDSRKPISLSFNISRWELCNPAQLLLSKTVYPVPFCTTGAEVTRLLLRCPPSSLILAFLTSYISRKKKPARKFYTYARNFYVLSANLSALKIKLCATLCRKF